MVDNCGFQMASVWAKTWDGVYLYFCHETGKFIRVGMCAFRSMLERGEEHKKSALLGTSEAMKSKFYRSYPRQSAVDKVKGSRRGTFERLEQMVVLSQDLNQKVDGMLKVFDISEQDNKSIDNLHFRMRGGTKPTLADKQRRSIYYVLEMIYGLLLCPEDNISENPGWEQGLKQYGR